MSKVCDFLPSDLPEFAHLIACIEGKDVATFLPVHQKILVQIDGKGLLVDRHAANEIYLAHKKLEGHFFSYVQVSARRSEPEEMAKLIEFAKTETIEVRMNFLRG